MLNFKKIACVIGLFISILSFPFRVFSVANAVKIVPVTYEPISKIEKNHKNLNFIIEKGVLKQYNGDETVVSIPSSVHTIGNMAFANNQKVEQIIFPETIRNIKDQAFSHCSNLKNVDLPNRLKKIGSLAFSNCTNLKSVSIGNNLTNIGEIAFYGCENLEKIEVSEENGVFKSYEGILYSKDLTKLIICPSGIKVVPSMPKVTEKILENAFFRCKKIESISFGENVKEICDGAFYGCENLKNIAINGKIEIIGAGTFIQCANLEKIKVGEKVKYIGKSAFAECDLLKEITFLSKDVKISSKMRFPKENFKIIGYKDSTAETYAEKRKINFEFIK